MVKVQPKSPQYEGVDPLTKGKTLYPREDTKAESEKLAETRDEEIAEGSEASKPQTTEPKTSSRQRAGLSLYLIASVIIRVCRS